MAYGRDHANILLAALAAISAVALAVGTAQFAGLAFVVALLIPIPQAVKVLSDLVLKPRDQDQKNFADARPATAKTKAKTEPVPANQSKEPVKRWKPFPWNWLPDELAFAIGTSIIVFIAPIMAVLIGSVLTWFHVMRWAWRHPLCPAAIRRLPTTIDSISFSFGRHLLRDSRNHSYLPWIFGVGIAMPLLFLWALHRHASHGLELSTLVIYHVLRAGPRFRIFGRIHTLAHKEGHDHKGLFKRLQILNGVVEWWIGPFYGIVPNSYSAGHVKIHHRWHNDVDDVHTNLDLDRTKLSSFILWMPRFAFYWTGLSPLALFRKRGEWALFRKTLSGMVVYYGLTLLIFLWSPVFCLAYWVFAHMEAIVVLGAVAYLWHAFVEESDPGNQYVNSITLLDGHDNTWNEDYHPVHHHCPDVHWTEMPAIYERNKSHYQAVTATIFKDCEQGMLLTWLFQKNWDMMAKHFVDLSNKLGHEEKMALLVRRLTYTVGERGRDGKRTEWASSATIRDF